MQKPRRGQWVPVVAGFLKKKDRLLIGQRPERSNLGRLWEFPGGKIEIGETPEQALARELREELGIEAEIGELRYATTHSYPDTGILLLFYEVPYWKGEPKAMHHMELRWILPDELKTLPIPDANRRAMDQLLKITTQL